MSLTQHRDAWVGSKRIAPEKLAQLKNALAQQAEVSLRAARDAKRDVIFANDFQAFYAAVDALAVASRQLSYVSHMANFMCDWGVAASSRVQ